MPVYIDVWVNDRAINTYAIGRIKGGTDPDDVNVYVVMDLEKMDRPLGWDQTIQYEHRYGDGLEVCIRKGLAALAGHRLKVKANCDHVDSTGLCWCESGILRCPECQEWLGIGHAGRDVLANLNAADVRSI